MRRRVLLGAISGASIGALAGCGGFDLRPANRAPPVIENRPAAVYVPTHIEGMAVIDTVESGDYGIGLTYSYPHRFWTTTGTRTERVTIRAEDSVHLMVSLWDPATRTVLPIGSGLTIEVIRDDEPVVERAPWPMISPTMGFHFGDNIALPSEGSYSIRVRLGPITDRLIGGFSDRFTAGTTATIPFEFSRRRRDELSYRTLSDRAGARGAPSMMEMAQVPISRVPPAEELPGEVLGRGTSGDARIAVVRQPMGDRTYLAVSPRTPYHRVPLPLMSMAIRLERGGETVVDGPLRSAIGPKLGFHYGSSVDHLQSGDRLEIRFEAPPQVSRHEGYETAFLEMPPVILTVS